MKHQRHYSDFDVVEIDENGGHLLIFAQLAHETLRLVIDTGASRTIFDHTRITNILPLLDIRLNQTMAVGLGTTTMKSFNASIENFSINGFAFKPFDAGVLDLSNITESYQQMGLGKIDGVLGGDLLIHYNAIIDYGKKTLCLRQAACEQKY